MASDIWQALVRGHSTEIVCLSFNPQSTVIATGSMDNTVGQCMLTLSKSVLKAPMVSALEARI